MSYRIKNTFLPLGYLEPIIFETLDMYLNGKDLKNSPLVEWGRKTLRKGVYWYGCGKALDQETCIQKRQREVIDLYHSLKEKGYNGSLISVFFDKEGLIHTYDGFHRLCIMKYLGMEVNVNIVISGHDPNPERRGDFPLVKTLMELNKGKNLYQPVNDPRVKDFNVWRADSRHRLAYILKNLKGKTVLDIGSSEGYFSHALAKRGYTVTALDSSRKRMAVTRYLSIINNLDLKYHTGKWEDYLKGEVFFDDILFLSVFHHNILALGVDQAFQALRGFRGRTDRLFFETPVSAGKISWLDKDKKTLYNFTENEFKTKIEKETNMKTKEIWHGIRPIFLLEAV